MKGDFSRIRFNPARQYTAVLEQQGRVSLDADTNEQVAINDYLGRNETVDVIGPFGAPEHDAGFAISVSGNEILIGAGRYYVEGLVCENRTDKLPCPFSMAVGSLKETFTVPMSSVCKESGLPFSLPSAP